MNTLYEFLDSNYDAGGEEELRRHLRDGNNADEYSNGETSLVNATRRRQSSAVTILLEFGVDIDAQNEHGKPHSLILFVADLMNIGRGLVYHRSMQKYLLTPFGPSSL